ncbi:peptidoglycan editing factor PgeF [soil metagenome]
MEASPLQSTMFSSLGGIHHGITRRAPGVEPAEANISYTAPRDQATAWAMRQHWCSAMGIDASTLAVPRQVHGSDVAIATASDAGAGATPGSSLFAGADGIITNEHGVALMTTHADCLPILMYAPGRQAVAAVHAGWRSTVTNVAGNTVSAMNNAFDVRAGDIHAFFGPAICASCYEVGPDVVDAWGILGAGGGSDVIKRDAGRTMFDLVAANQTLLLIAGVPIDQMDISNICTKCNDGEWFTHRGQGPLTGRFGSIIALDNGL